MFGFSLALLVIGIVLISSGLALQLRESRREHHEN
jgi:hypothetical protein